MAANRKLQGEIQQVLKKIEEGVEIFDETMSKVYSSETQALKEKFEADLKKEIKKLQRLRDQVKNWIGSNEVKDKAPLTDAKKLIETKMELFKICEKDTKTKAYSKEGLAREAKLDPKDALREEKRQWLNDSLEQLQDFINTVEAEKEKLQNTKGKSKNKEGNLEKFDNRIQKHKWHMAKIELIMRLLDSEEIDPSSLDNIKDSLEYYLETAADDDGALGVEHEFDIYEDLKLDSYTNSNHHDNSPRPGHGSETTPTTTAEQPDQKSPKAISLPEKEKEKEKDAHPSNEKEKVSSTESSHSKTTAAPVNAAKHSKAAAAPAATSHATHLEKENKTAVTSPAVVAQSNQPKVTAAAIVAGSHHNAAHPPSNATGPGEPTTVPSKPAVTVAQIVAQNIPAAQPSSTAPVNNAAPSAQQPAVSTSSTANTVSANSTPRVGLNTPASLPATPGLTPLPGVSAPPSMLQTTASATNALSEDMEKLQLGRAQPGLQPQPGLVGPKMTSPQSMPMSNPAQMKSPLKMPMPGVVGAMGDISGIGGQVPGGVNLTGILGNVPGSSLTTSPASAASVNPPGMTPEMLATLNMLRQSAMYLPEPDHEKISTYTPRNAYNTHPLFPTQPLYSNMESTQLFEKLSYDTYFFAFYFQQGSYQQYLAAKKLKKGSWRFHRKYTTWFQRHNEPKITTKDYEEGTYLYFDYESGWCNRIKTEFKFEYAFLEDEVSI